MRTAIAELARPALRGLIRGAGIGGFALGLAFLALGYLARVSCPLDQIALAGLVLGGLWLGPLVGSAVGMGRAMRQGSRIRPVEGLVFAASLGAGVSALGAAAFFWMISVLDPRETFDYAAVVWGGLSLGGVIAPATCLAVRALASRRRTFASSG